MAPFTLCKTNASEVKYRLIKGIIDTRETSSKPKLAPTFRKLFTVFCKALALATLRSLIPCIAGTKLCATWLSAYNVTESDVRRLRMDNEKCQYIIEITYIHNWSQATEYTENNLMRSHVIGA